MRDELLGEGSLSFARVSRSAIAVIAASLIGCSGGAGRAPMVVLPPPALALEAAPEHVDDAREARSNAPPPIAWMHVEREAREKAKALGAPLVVFVAAHWDPGSVAMDRGAWADPRVRAAMRDVVALRMQADTELDHDAAVASFGISTLPATLLIAADGHRLGALEREATAEQVLGLLMTARE